MPDLEDDIDNVFKQASENYRLKEAEDNWNEIAGKLSPGKVIPVSKNGSNKKLWLLLLVLLIAGGAFLLYNHKPAESITNKNQVKTINHADYSNEEVAGEKINERNTSQQSEDNKINEGTYSEIEDNFNPKLKAKKSPGKYNIKIYSSGSQMEDITSNVAGDPAINNQEQKKLSTNPNSRINILSPDAESDIAPAIDPGEDEMSSADNKIGEYIPSEMNSDSSIISGNRVSKDSLIKKDNAADPIPPDDKQNKRRGLLIGLSGGPEWNQVRNQKITKAGYDIGLVLGYKFNNRLSIETGIGVARKYYYSQGKYFKLDMPGKEILSLEGSTSIIEIPLKLKYNFPLKNKSSLFGSAGMMSYLLTDETNDYILLVNGAEMNMTNNYPEASRYFAGAIDLGAGYEYFINPMTSLRIEPYVQIPLKGIGVGKMHVMSFGLHAGISRFLKRSRK